MRRITGNPTKKAVRAYIEEKLKENDVTLTEFYWEYFSQYKEEINYCYSNNYHYSEHSLMEYLKKSHILGIPTRWEYQEIIPILCKWLATNKNDKMRINARYSDDNLDLLFYDLLVMVLLDMFNQAKPWNEHGYI